MKPLSDILRKNGFTYTLVLREGQSCIYEQSVAEKTAYYEVFIVQVRPQETIKGKMLPNREVFPGNEDFGVTAWSCRTLDDAMKRFEKLKK